MTHNLYFYIILKKIKKKHPYWSDKAVALYALQYSYLKQKRIKEITMNSNQEIREIFENGSKALAKANRIKRIYEDNDFIIELIAAEEPTLRVSVFKDNHFQDEVFIRKDDYCGKQNNISIR